MGKLAKRLGAAALGLGLAVVAAELGLRTLAPQGVVTDWVRYDAVPERGPDGTAIGVGYRMRPRQFVPGALGGPINGLGLRGEDWAARGAAGRVLVLGDSFVFGAGVAEGATFVAGLDRGLAAQVVNGGTPGYGTWRQMAWLETYGEELELDRVLLCVFEGNDFMDNLSTRAPDVVGGVLFGPAEDEGAPSAARAWLGRSHLWRALTKRRAASGGPEPKPRRATAANAAVDESAAAARHASVLDAFARQQAPRLAAYVPADLDDSALTRRMELAFDMTELALDGIAAWCAARAVELDVVLIPDVLAVDPQQRARALAMNQDPELGAAFDEARALGHAEGVDLERPRAALRAWCAERGLDFLDLTPVFRARTAELRAADPNDEGLYLFGDSHWNVRGHALAAETIAPLLKGAD